jgi:hypothetical protein
MPPLLLASTNFSSGASVESVEQPWAVRICAGIAVFIVAVSVQAQSDERNTPEVDAFAAQPGAEVIKRKEGDREIVEVLRGGVIIRQDRRGNKLTVTGTDNTGHGAVLCAWEISISMRDTLDACFPSEYAEVRSDLNDAIAAMNKFIVANSLTPTSLADVEAAVAARRNPDMHTGASPITPKQLARERQSGELGRFLSGVLKTTHEERVNSVSDLLSVPRPPVMNPCL